MRAAKRKAEKPIIAAVAVTVCVAQGCAADPTIGDTVHIADNSLACINYDDLNTLLSLRRADQEAFIKLAIAECDTLKAGTGTVEALKTPTACVRPKGEVDCVWTLRSYLTVIKKDGAK